MMLNVFPEYLRVSENYVKTDAEKSSADGSSGAKDPMTLFSQETEVLFMHRISMTTTADL